MRSISAVGFDMDYTLAQYLPETFEQLAYELTLTKLVPMGYPEEIMSFKFDCHYMVRGLAIDKARGNIIKMDRHKYVKIAMHGFTELTREERLRAYGENMEAVEDSRFAMIDTLFSLGEAYLFAQLVEHRDAHPEAYGSRSYADMYRDIRGAVDLCHRDGSLKRAVAEDPGKYIHADPSLVHLLELLRASGKRVFLVTNSLWDYTNVVMNYLCEGKTGGARSLDWLRWFDVVVTGAAKPRFFQSDALSIFQVDPLTGHLSNTDNGGGGGAAAGAAGGA